MSYLQRALRNALISFKSAEKNWMCSDFLISHQAEVAYYRNFNSETWKKRTQEVASTFLHKVWKAVYDCERTGYPDIKTGPAALSITVPVRYCIHSSIQALNGENYNQSDQKTRSDAIFTTRVWWDVK